jgi:hypothetical protein
MSRPETLPVGGPSREAVARRDLGHTAVSRVTVRVILAFFLILILGVPLAELLVVRAHHAEGVATAWSYLSQVPREIRAYLGGVRASAQKSSSWQHLISTNRIVLAGLTSFERALEDESVIGRLLRPPAQVVMTGWLGAGNERVYPGRDGWLFFRQDVEYITRPGFLEPAQIQRRIAAAPAWTNPPQPDPRDAIVQFKRDLDARGIALVVMPTPLKPGVHPEKLARRYANVADVLENPSYRRFIEDLQRDGVLVLDLSATLAAVRGSNPQYLATDTHWRPETMESVAGLVGDFILAQAQLPVREDSGYRIERVETRNSGDIARMLDLPEDATLFPPEVVWLRRVLQPDGSLWRSSRAADVLVLGDSFSNIYSLESMGWGTSAGFVEQLSYNLRRPVDRLTQNDQASFATRAMLQQDPNRLDGKRVVLYQFAVRELTDGDWKVLPLNSR